jgi:hypothetical protein
MRLGRIDKPNQGSWREEFQVKSPVTSQHAQPLARDAAQGQTGYHPRAGSRPRGRTAYAAVIDTRAWVAARNNAEWCDLVCRGHGVTTQLDARLSRRGIFYSVE